MIKGTFFYNIPDMYNYDEDFYMVNHNFIVLYIIMQGVNSHVLYLLINKLYTCVMSLFRFICKHNVPLTFFKYKFIHTLCTISSRIKTNVLKTVARVCRQFFYLLSLRVANNNQYCSINKCMVN